LRHAALSDNTHRTYAAAIKSYTEFCNAFPGRFSIDHPTVDSIAKWITYLADYQFKKLAWSTINTYVSGLRSATEESGLDASFFSDIRIAKLLNGVAHTSGTKPKTNRLPLTSTILSSVVRVIKDKGSPSYEDHLMLAAMAAGIFGLMRGGEFVQTTNYQKKDSILQLRQLKAWFYDQNRATPKQLLCEVPLRQLKHRMSNEVNPLYPDAITITLKVAKNDPTKSGTEVRICNPMGIQLIIDYLVKSHPDIDAVDGSLFVHQDRSPLTGIELVAKIQEYLLRARIPNPNFYTLHSLRKGGAQTLRDMGASEELIQLAGRWKSGAAAKLYSRQSLSECILASRRISSALSH